MWTGKPQLYPSKISKSDFPVIATIQMGFMKKWCLKVTLSRLRSEKGVRDHTKAYLEYKYQEKSGGLKILIFLLPISLHFKILINFQTKNNSNNKIVNENSPVDRGLERQ